MRVAVLAEAGRCRLIENSASRRPLAILNTQRATASLLRRGRVLPVTIATLIMFHHLMSRGRKDLSSNGAAS